MTKGKWKLEAWGASATHKARGGYSSGILIVKKKLHLYIHIGSSADDGHCNGGGSGVPVSSSENANGGGGTDIRAYCDTLFHRFLVAGGAGASAANAAGGGLNGVGTNISGRGSPGLYNGPGINCYKSGSDCSSGTFGYGGNGTKKGCGCGGGWWYGGSSGSPNSNFYISGAGGSGYALNKTSFRPEGYQLNNSINLFLKKVKLISGNQLMP